MYIQLLLHNPERGRKPVDKPRFLLYHTLLLHNPERGRKPDYKFMYHLIAYYYYITPKGDGNIVSPGGLVFSCYYYYITPKGDGNCIASPWKAPALSKLLLHNPERGRKRAANGALKSSDLNYYYITPKGDGNCFFI